MAESLAHIDVVVTVVYCGERLMLVWNAAWGAFTLPMTKLRRWPLGETRTRWELGSEAVMRNVAEALGTTSVEPPRLLMDLGNVAQSDRTGQLNQYTFQVYGFPVDAEHAGPATATWLTAEEIRDERRQPVSPTARTSPPGGHLTPRGSERRQPVSPTARTLLAALAEAALDRKTEFPPPAGPPRESVASIAVIARDSGGRKTWLCQWNESWGRYFLVGGHQHDGESPEACMTRELKEELDLDAGDYTCQPHEVLTYEDWSTSAWQMTDYTFSTFDVELNPAAEIKLRGSAANVPNPANRWVTAEEIRSDRCRDDKLISPTARIVLTRLGEV